MAMMEISVVPIGTASASVSDYVARAVKIIRDTPGVEHELTAMGTIVVGDVETLLALAGRLHKSVLEAGAARAITTLKLDERTDKLLTIEGKKRAVNEKLK